MAKYLDLTWKWPCNDMQLQICPLNDHATTCNSRSALWMIMQQHAAPNLPSEWSCNNMHLQIWPLNDHVTCSSKSDPWMIIQHAAPDLLFEWSCNNMLLQIRPLNDHAMTCNPWKCSCNDMQPSSSWCAHQRIRHCPTTTMNIALYPKNHDPTKKDVFQMKRDSISATN